MKVLYLYAGTRKQKFGGRLGVDAPDTQFYGLNHFEPLGIDAQYKEWDTRLPFRLKHFLMYFATRGYDLVFGSPLLYMMPLKILFNPRRKFVLLNIGITRTLAVNKKNPLSYLFLRKLLGALDGVVCLARFQVAYLEERFPFLRGKVFFVPLGVDTAFYQPRYSGRKDYILSAGRDNGRDYKTVLEVATRMPEREFHIVCSPRNLKEVGAVPPNVKVIYDLPFGELHKKYQEAALLLLLTHDDTFGDGADCSGQTVLLDAMANGLPTVVSRKHYVGDYIEEGKEALLVECYNAEAAARAAQTLLEDPVRAETFARNARARVEKEFSTQAMAKQLSQVFSRLR